MEFNLTLYNRLLWNYPNLVTHCRSASGAKHMKMHPNSYTTIIFTCALLLTPGNTSARTLYAATANRSDVAAAILQAADGDTIAVPDTRSLPGGAAALLRIKDAC